MKAVYTPDTDIETAIESYIEDADSHASERERKRILPQFVEILNSEGIELETVEDIHPDHISIYSTNRKNSGVREATISNEINPIQGLTRKYNHFDFLNLFNKSDLKLNTNTVIQDSDKVPHIKTDEYIKMLQSTDSLRNECILRILWETGVRRSECSKIDIEDIDFNENKITIDSAKSNDTRSVWFDFSTEQKLRTYINRHRDTIYPNPETDALFINWQGTRLTPHAINSNIVKIAERSGVQDSLGENAKGDSLNRVTAHSFRHSFAVQRLQNGCSIKYIADMLGNTVKTTANTYLQTDDEDIKEQNERYRPKVYSTSQIESE